MNEYQKIIHPLDPIYNKNSRILILGTMPSPKSREQAFYYAHPRNRFWQVMSLLFESELNTNEEKTDFLLSHGIALWDVLHSCEILNAADNSIRNPKANDIKKLIDSTSIGSVFTTGRTAYSLYEKLCFPDTGIKAVCLPSTSPANASFSLEKLAEAYSVILNRL